MSWWTDFRDTVLKPVAVIGAVVVGGPLLGEALFGSLIAEGTISAGMAAAIGTGAVSGGITALQGGSASDVLKSALTAGTMSYIGGQVADALKSSGISSAAIDAANATSDPVAALNASQGWTITDIPYLQSIGAAAADIGAAIATNASKFNVAATPVDLSVQNYANTAENLQYYSSEAMEAFKNAGLDPTTGVQNANGSWTFTNAAGEQVWAPSLWNTAPEGYVFSPTGELVLADQAAADATILRQSGVDPATHELIRNADGSTSIISKAGGSLNPEFAAKLNATQYAQANGIDTASIQNYKNMGYTDDQILKAINNNPNGGWGGELISQTPGEPVSVTKQVGGTYGPDNIDVGGGFNPATGQPGAPLTPVTPTTVTPGTTPATTPGTTTTVNPLTGLTETVTPGTGTNPVATVTLTETPVTTPTTPINPALVGAGVVGAGVVGAGGGTPTTPATTPPTNTTPPPDNLPPVETRTPDIVNPPTPDPTLPQAIGNWSSALLESVGLGGMTASQILGLMAAGALAPSVLQALGLIEAPKTATGPNYGPLDYTPLPAFSKTELVQPGLNPGLIPSRPYYQTTNELQPQYYWGKAPYIGTAEDIGKLQNIPGAPVTPFGYNAKLPSFDVNKFIQQTINPQQTQALAGAGGQYNIVGGAPVQQAAPVTQAPVTQAPVQQTAGPMTPAVPDANTMPAERTMPIAETPVKTAPAPAANSQFADFYASPEYLAYKTALGDNPIGTMDTYDSPYFGMQSSGSIGRAQDAAYEQYLARVNPPAAAPVQPQLQTLVEPVAQIYTPPASQIYTPPAQQLGGPPPSTYVGPIAPAEPVRNYINNGLFPGMPQDNTMPGIQIDPVTGLPMMVGPVAPVAV